MKHSNAIKILFSILFTSFCISVLGQSNYDRRVTQDYFQSQEFDKAIEYMKAFPGDSSIQYHYDLGYAYYVQQNYGNALKHFMQTVRKDSAFIPGNLYLAFTYDNFKDPATALEYWKKLIALKPDNYMYWRMASSALGRLDLKDSAFVYIEKSNTLNPANGDVAVSYARALTAKKLQARAEAVIDNFLERDTTNDRVVSEKITMRFKNQDYKEVIYWGRKLLARNAEVPAAYTNLAYAYLNTNKPDKAIEIYNYMNAGNMKNESITYCAALAYAKKNDFASSNELLQECLGNNLNKDATIYFRSRADNAIAVKEYNKAVANYDSSYYIFHDADDLYYAANVYDHYLKDKTKASSYYRKYINVRKSPKTPNETKIFEYINAYLKPRQN